MPRLLILLSILAAFSANRVSAATLTLTSTDLFVYFTATPDYYNQSSPEYTSLLDLENLGSYTWLIPNNTAATWTNVPVIFFLDAEWDVADNLASNEYADFFGFGLPTGAPLGAIPFTSWEADEPGYVSGDIYTHVSLDGVLDNTNAVDSAAVNDVSVALGWLVGESVAPGQSLRITILHLTADLTGIAHLDPDTPATFTVNGYYEILGDPPPVNGVPEPASVALVIPALVACYLRKRKGSL